MRNLLMRFHYAVSQIVLGRKRVKLEEERRAAADKRKYDLACRVEALNKRTDEIKRDSGVFVENGAHS